jgi:hypothetical protein
LLLKYLKIEDLDDKLKEDFPFLKTEYNNLIAGCARYKTVSHKMRRIYRTCCCGNSCKLKIKIINCNKENSYILYVRPQLKQVNSLI